MKEPTRSAWDAGKPNLVFANRGDDVMALRPCGCTVFKAWAIFCAEHQEKAKELWHDGAAS